MVNASEYDYLKLESVNLHEIECDGNFVNRSMRSLSFFQRTILICYFHVYICVEKINFSLYIVYHETIKNITSMRSHNLQGYVRSMKITSITRVFQILENTFALRYLR